MPVIAEGHSHSIDLDWVLRLAEKKPVEAIKCIVYYIKLRDGLTPTEHVYQKGWGKSDG